MKKNKEKTLVWRFLIFNSLILILACVFSSSKNISETKILRENIESVESSGMLLDISDLNIDMNIKGRGVDGTLENDVMFQNHIIGDDSNLDEDYENYVASQYEY